MFQEVLLTLSKHWFRIWPGVIRWQAITWINDDPGGGALLVKISRGARLEVQNGTQQDLNEIIDLVNFGGKKIVYMLKMGGFEMGPNKIWIKW